jgi:hypothetical protein
MLFPGNTYRLRFTETREEMGMSRNILAWLFALTLCLSSAAADDTTEPGTVCDPAHEGEITRSAPVLVIDFDDTIPMHNMGIAADAACYYTSNGGNAGSGQINTYDLSGTFISSTACNIDMRAILFNSSDGKLYTKVFGSDLYEVDPSTGAATLYLSGIFHDAQSAPAITPDGQYLVENVSGTVYIMDFATGAVVNTLTGLSCGGFPSSIAVGTDGNRIFTWNGNTVYVYDMAGVFIESYTLPNGNYGFSLKFVNGLLFASVDGSGGTGHWYGYDVGASALEPASWGSIKSLFQ